MGVMTVWRKIVNNFFLENGRSDFDEKNIPY